MPSTHVLALASPELGRTAAPGQFVHIRSGPTWDPLLRRPMSIYKIRPDGVSIMVRAIGAGSTMIAASVPGGWLDCLGPLGTPFELGPDSRRLLMVGGGYGVAPLVALAELALPRDREVVLLVGAASAQYVFPSALLPTDVEYEVATVDGTLGHHGLVTELAARYLEWSDAIYACGPTPMLRAVALAARPLARAGGEAVPSTKRVELAMEQDMGCAMGVCLACVVKTRRGLQRVCRDGPVLRAEELVWESSA